MSEALDIVRWKQMLASHIANGTCPSAVVEWLADCALYAYENGILHDEIVCEWLEDQERKALSVR